MTIPPDTKSWVWVLERQCPECGFDASTVVYGSISGTGRRSDGASFTVDSLARYFVHDPIHHLHDVAGEPSVER